MGMGVDWVGVGRGGHIPHLLPQIRCHSVRREAGEREESSEEGRRGEGGDRGSKRLAHHSPQLGASSPGLGLQWASTDPEIGSVHHITGTSNWFLKWTYCRTSLVVQWLRLQAPYSGGNPYLGN